MSSKAQQGAAGNVEDPAEVPSARFARLRALPGFRTAAVAFVLTVVLGLGSTAAYAYWKAATNATISVTAAAKLATPTGLKCEWYSDPNRIFWQPVADTEVDRDAVYFLTFTRDGRSKSYAVPRTTTDFRPAKHENLRLALGQTGLELRPLVVTLQTAVLREPLTGAAPKEKSQADILVASQGTSLNMYYYTSIWANYPCGRY